MVTHDVDAAGVADKQFHLDHGRLVQTGGPGATPSNHPATQESAG